MGMDSNSGQIKHGHQSGCSSQQKNKKNILHDTFGERMSNM